MCLWYACKARKTISQVAREMYVSHSTIERFLHLYYITGEVKSTQQKCGPDRMLDDFEQLTVLQSFLNKPGIYLREVQEKLYDATGEVGELYHNMSHCETHWLDPPEDETSCNRMLRCA